MMAQTTTLENIQERSREAIELLKSLIETPSLSKEEADTALLIEAFFTNKGISFQRKKNNIWAYSKYFDPAKPTVLLNSHHDTVKPNKSWTLNPYQALVEGRLLRSVAGEHSPIK